MSLVEDPGGKLTIRQVVEAPQAFRKVATDVPVFANRDSYVWARLTIVNRTGHHLWLGIGNPVTDTVYYYEFSSEGMVTKLSGDKVALDRRDLQSNRLLFHITQTTEPVTIYLRMNIRLPRQFPVYVTNADAIMQGGSTSFFVDGLFYGLIIVIILYNLFLWVSLRERFYLFYIGYILFSGLVLMHFDGITYAYLWSDSPSFNDHPAVLASLPMFFALFFAALFLDLKQNQPAFLKGLWILGALLALGSILSLAGFKYPALTITQGTAFISAVYFLVIGIVIFRKGYKPARYFLAAWGFLIAGVLVFLGKDIALLPYNVITSNALKLGIGAEAVMMAFALADRINFLKTEQTRLQRESERERKQRLKAEDELKNAASLLEQYTDHLKQKNSLIEKFSAEMAELEQKLKGVAIDENPEYLQKLRESIILTENDWQDFRGLFNQVHSGYIYRLKDKYTGLTESEIRLLTLMKLRLSQNEMANMLGVSNDAVRKAKQRLKKKLNMSPEETLEDLVSLV